MYSVILNFENEVKVAKIYLNDDINVADYPNDFLYQCSSIEEVATLIYSRLDIPLNLEEIDTKAEVTATEYTQYIVEYSTWFAVKLSNYALVQSCAINSTLLLPTSNRVYISDDIYALINTVLK